MSHSSWDIKNIFRKAAKFQFYSIKISVIFPMLLVNSMCFFFRATRSADFNHYSIFPHGCSL